MGDDQIFEQLLSQLEDGNWHGRLEAIKALGQLDDARVFPVLITLMRDQDARIRESVVEILGKVGDRRAVPYLCDALGDWSWHVCEQSAIALRDLKDPRAVPFLVSALEKRACKSVAAALGEIGDPQSIPALCDALKPASPHDTRCEAIRALGRIGDPIAVDALCQALSDPDERIRIFAAKALGELAERTTASSLRGALRPLRRRFRWLDSEWDEFSAYDDAIRKIEAATSKNQALPVSVGSHRSKPANFPVAHSATTNLEHTPVPAPSATAGRDTFPQRLAILSGRLGALLDCVVRYWTRKQ